MSRLENSIRNIASGFVNRMVMVVGPFVLRSFLIRVLGAEYLGINGLFTSVLQVLNLAELGLSSAIIYSMYKPIAEGDDEMVCALMAFYRKVYRIIGLVVLLVGCIILPFVPALIHGSVPDNINVYSVYFIFLVNSAVSYFLFSHWSCVLIAGQRADVTTNILTFVSIIQYVVQIFLILKSKNYYGYIIALPFFTIANNGVCALFARRIYPMYKCEGVLSDGVLGEIKKNISGLVIQKLSYVSRNVFDSIFISSFLGLTAVAIYSNYYYVMDSVHNIIVLIIPAIVASVGNSIVSESVDKNFKDFKKIYFIYLWLGGWFSICLVCLYQPFMELWAGKELVLENETMILFGCYFFLNCIGDITSLYIQSIGLWHRVKYVYLTNAIANIILNIVLVKMWGIFGIVIATIITAVVLGPFLHCRVIFEKYFVGKKYVRYMLSIIASAIVTVIAGTISYVICSLYEGTILMTVIVRAIICSIVPNILFLAFYLKTSIFKESKEMVYFIFKKILTKVRRTYL